MSDKTFTLGEWAETPFTTFDLRPEFHERIEPLVNQLHATCLELGLPMFTYIAYKQDQVGASARLLSALPEELGMIPPEAMMHVMLTRPTPEDISKLHSIYHAALTKIKNSKPQTKH